MSENTCACTQPKEEVAEWLNSVEYKEKNFSRKALAINPSKACQPLGALLCALGIDGCLPFVHGSQGCAAYFRNTLNRHLREPVPTVSDSMTEDSAVFGGQANLIEGLKNAYQIYKPQMIAVFTSCMAEVIGDDLNAFITNARNAGSVPQDFPIAYAQTPSFVGSHITGWDNMFKALLQSLADPRHGRWTNGRLYVVPGFDAYPGNLREYKRLVSSMGIPMTMLPDASEAMDSPHTGEYQIYPGGTPMSELADALNASGFIFMQRYSTVGSFKFVKNVQKINTEVVTMPIGIGNTDKFLMALHEMTGKPIPAELEKERGRAVDSATDAHQYIHGKRFAMFGDPDLLLGLTGFLLEMGGIPAHIVCTNGSEQFRKDIQAVLDASPFGKDCGVHIGRDLWHLRSLLMTEPVDMLIGDSHGKFDAKDANIPLVRIGFPIMDRVNLHRSPIVGYQGAINLVTMIANTFMDQTDRTCPDRLFELMR
ncbi:nitrogenase molybdenum-iron protein subunit beta [Heliobacterium gestii]|uniref:Nitrogenase molybdenum-iron protein beta chain n=1 Tax=Heliomicrobium gestii TaxID=2699 RepID=A0A845LEJ4_HELGE|nr:nitrogenase molybdenum-iron protein subunit beta [Heliomicrobium gestii]MBM7868423.1 nitrogenase molybdenum-iron protein beta chain [Heliomicrobium gestii]MZP44588.1 nitrogenase molybdenum-iron protein subunit beta [Heliomicrobium gestii]